MAKPCRVIVTGLPGSEPGRRGRGAPNAAPAPGNGACNPRLIPGIIRALLWPIRAPQALCTPPGDELAIVIAGAACIWSLCRADAPRPLRHSYSSHARGIASALHTFWMIPAEGDRRSRQPIGHPGRKPGRNVASAQRPVPERNRGETRRDRRDGRTGPEPGRTAIGAPSRRQPDSPGRRPALAAGACAGRFRKTS
jgi:hypothetical protein